MKKYARYILWFIGTALIVGGLVMMNLAINYSSVPRYHQQGWAEFCGINAVWVIGLGILCWMMSDTYKVDLWRMEAMRAADEELA